LKDHAHAAADLHRHGGHIDHIFTIEHIGNERVRFVQREIFSGVLVASRAHDLEMKMRLGFEQMNQALKTRAEQVCAFNP